MIVSAIALLNIACWALLSLVKNKQQELHAPLDLLQADICFTACSTTEAPAEAQVPKAAQCGGPEPVGEVIYPTEKLIFICLGCVHHPLQCRVPWQEDTFLQLNCSFLGHWGVQTPFGSFCQSEWECLAWAKQQKLQLPFWISICSTFCCIVRE